MDNTGMNILRVSAAKRPQFRLRPDCMVDGVQHIDFKYLKKQGITTCLVDLDGTVVERGTYEVSSIVKSKLRTSGVDIYIATNRPKSRSLKDLKEDLHAKGVIHPKGVYAKPARRYYDNALRDHGLNHNEVAMIGDRLLQDVFGANRAGVYSILVKRLGASTSLPERLLAAIETACIKRFSDKYEQL